MKVTVTKHDAHQVVVAEMAIPLKQDGFALSQALLAAMGQLATGYRHDVPPGAGLSEALRTEWPTVVSGTINFIGADEPETISVPATGLKELKVGKGRVAIAFEFPEIPAKLSEAFRNRVPATDEQKVAFKVLVDSESANRGVPVHTILGFGSREEMEAQHRRDGARSAFERGLSAIDLPQEVKQLIRDKGLAPSAAEPEPVWATVPDGGWSHDSLADLIRESTEHDGTCPIQVGTVVYRGIKRFDDPASFIPGADEIINDMANNAAASDAGEWADDYPNVTDDAQAELNDFLTAWARKHAPVEKFYCVDAIEVYTVTAEDLAQ